MALRDVDALLDLAGRERHVQVDAFVAMLAREWVVDLAGYKNLYENAPTKHAVLASLASRRHRVLHPTFSFDSPPRRNAKRRGARTPSLEKVSARAGFPPSMRSPRRLALVYYSPFAR